MGRPSTLDRWTAEELQSLEKMALKDSSKDAMEVARLFVEKYPTRTLDAAKQRVFKIRREQKGVPPRIKGVSQGASAKTAPPPRQQAKPAAPDVAPEAPVSKAAVSVATPTAKRSLSPDPENAEWVVIETRNGHKVRGTPEAAAKAVQALDRTA